MLEEDAQQLWLLGLDPGSQDVVRGALLARRAPTAAAGTAQVLHAVLGATQDCHHWLIRASRAEVQELLEAHQHVTAAPLPDSMKISPTIDTAVSACAEATAVGGQATIATSCVTAVQDMVHLSHAGAHVRVVLVALVEGVAAGRMAELAQRAQAQLRQVLGGTAHSAQEGLPDECQPTVKAGRRELVVRGLCLQHVDAAARLLATFPEATWLELQPRMQLTDLYSIADQQAAPSAWLPQGSYPAPDVTSSQLRPFWAAGIDGKGQVAGVVDSGVDMDSCFVYDPAQADYLNGPNTNNGIYLNPSARKVVMYAMAQDGIDDLESHGTHVATSMAGSVYNVDPVAQPDMAVGVAPGAQLAVVDVGFTYSNGTGAEELSFDSFNTIDQVWDLLAQGGAVIAGNSWGSKSTYNYTHSSCTALDEYAWNHPEALQVFAAGNSGSTLDELSTSGTVAVPGTCKSVLTVGAAENYVLQGRSDLRSISDLTVDLLDAQGAQVQLAASNFSGPFQRGQLRILFPDGTGYRLNPLPLQGFDSRISNLGSSSCQVAVADPPDACSSLTAATFTVSRRRRQLQQSPSCWFLIVARSARCTIATALSFVTADSRVRGAYFYFSAQSVLDSVTLNAITVQDPGLNGFAAGLARNSTVADALVQDLQANAGASILASFLSPSAQDPAPVESVAYFSSYGSGRAFLSDDSSRSRLYRIKPEIVAPGYIMAGRSDGKFSGKQDQCATFTIAGTSMATPQVTGAVILARQYFMDGFYPTGAKVAENAFEPTAALLKAVLIAGAQAMTGFSDADGEALAPPPSQFQGFGRVALWASLPLAGVSTRPGLQVVDRAMLAQGETHTFTVDVVSNGQPLAVVLAFQDWPTFPGARQSAVNDLDLLVTDPSGSSYYPNGRSSSDPTNNIEKVFITSPAAGTYTITVQGAYVFVEAKAQPYALVVLGALAPDAQLRNASSGATSAPPPSSDGSSSPPPSSEGATDPPELPSPPPGAVIGDEPRPPPSRGGVTGPVSGRAAPPPPPVPPGGAAGALASPAAWLLQLAVTTAAAVLLSTWAAAP